MARHWSEIGTPSATSTLSMGHFCAVMTVRHYQMVFLPPQVVYLGRGITELREDVVMPRLALL